MRGQRTLSCACAPHAEMATLRCSVGARTARWSGGPTARVLRSQVDSWEGTAACRRWRKRRSAGSVADWVVVSGTICTLVMVDLVVDLVS
eukprot:COSAG02_NODE_27080_length_617_cov_1.083012_2_plen_90_part_00